MSSDSPVVDPPVEEEVRRDLLLLRAVRRIAQDLDVHSRRLSESSRITLPQLLCLMAVVAEEGLTAREIARAIFVSPSTLVGVIDRLEAKALIERVRDRKDRRKIRLRSTPAGVRLVGELPSPFGASFSDAFAELSARRQQELIRAFTVIAEMMEQGPTAAPVAPRG